MWLMGIRVRGSGKSKHEATDLYRYTAVAFIYEQTV
jgi:hypothetical protein